MHEPPPPSRWLAGAVWAVPFALWLCAILVTVVGIPVQVARFRENADQWRAAIEQSHHEGDATMAAQQEGWLARDRRSFVIGLASLGGGALLVVAAPFGYLTLVPKRWRGGWRAALLSVLVFVAISVAGIAIAASELRGTITG